MDHEAPQSLRPALVVTHVPWEGPHRIADALSGVGLELDERCVLKGDPLPNPGEVAGAVFMGGPMNVDEVRHHPGLADERGWLSAAIEDGLPVLGVCLGAQLIARALGSGVRPARARELGWHDVEIVEDDDILNELAPESSVLHWHGDEFDLPPGSTLLARSAACEVQAFRHKNAMALLFHAEADLSLVDRWLAEPTMADEARAVLGPDFAERLRAGARSAQRTGLDEQSDRAFSIFAQRLLDGAAG